MQDALDTFAMRLLVDSYRFPESWIGSRLVGSQAKKAARFQLDERFRGAFALTKKGDPFLIVCTGVGTTADEVEAQLRAQFEHLPFTGLGIAAGPGIAKPRMLRRRFENGRFDHIGNMEAYVSPADSDLFSLPYARKSASSNQRSLRGISEKLENLFFEAHCRLRDIDGLHDDEALDELCKLLFVKMYDEQSTDPSALLSFQRCIYCSPEEMSTTIRRMYEDALRDAFRASAREADAPAPLRISTASLREIVGLLEHYDIGGSSLDIRGRAFQRVLRPTMRSGMGQYFTPDPVVRFLAKCVAPRFGERVIDPFCGSGHFLSATAKLMSEDGKSSSHEGLLFGIEKSERMARVAFVDLALAGCSPAKLINDDSLVRFSNLKGIAQEGFDVVLTNPPFGSTLPADALNTVGPFELATGATSLPLEIAGLERSLQLLKPGGRLGIVMPESILANKRSRFVREWLDSKVIVRGIISLPIQTFAPFGANVKTCILVVRKKYPGEINEGYKVFMGRVDAVGYDASGRELGHENELPELATKFRAFIESEGW